MAFGTASRQVLSRDSKMCKGTEPGLSDPLANRLLLLAGSVLWSRIRCRRWAMWLLKFSMMSHHKSCRISLVAKVTC